MTATRNPHRFSTRPARLALAATLAALSACSSATPADRVAHASPAQTTSVRTPTHEVVKAVATDQASPMTLAASLDASHAMSLRFGRASLRLSTAACSEFTSTLSHCTKDVSIAIDDPSRQIRQTLHPDQLWIDSQHTFYRGPLSDTGSPRAGDYTIIWGDANGDGEADLIVQTGKDGSYGGPSFDVYLYERATHEMVYNKPLSELTVGHNSLFSLKKGVILASATSGCCEHVHESYRFDDGKLTLITRSTETNKQRLK